MQFSNVQFKIAKCETKPGQKVLVVGSFCEWDTNKAIEMASDSQRYPLWMSDSYKLATGKIGTSTSLKTISKTQFN